MSDDSPPSSSVARLAPRGEAAISLREALEAVAAHQQAVRSAQAEAAQRDEQRERALMAYKARSEVVRAEARALQRGIPKHRRAEWSPAERALVRAALRAAVTLRLNQTLGELPPVPAPATVAAPKLRLTTPQRRALRAAQARAEKAGQTLLPEGFQLERRRKKKVPPVKATKKVSASGRRGPASAATPEEAVVTVSPPGPWSISEDGLE
jgi:hypothetical protein